MRNIDPQRRTLERGADGFTLLELMVVVTILGVLLAVAIPTLLGARDRASDTSAKAKASLALKAQKVAASDAPQRFKTAAELTLEESSLRALPLADGGEPSVLGAVYVKDPSGDVVTLVAKSATGKCFWTRASKNGSSEYATNDCNPASPLLWKGAW